LEIVALRFFVGMRLYLQHYNRQLARMWNVDAEFMERGMKKLQKTAQIEGIDIAAARVLQEGYRYMT
jgi:hypothetical protein